jgi:hypothetical protein|nr:MAG TPA: hypothetical protein [Caudoviricetes sp.]
MSEKFFLIVKMNIVYAIYSRPMRDDDGVYIKVQIILVYSLVSEKMNFIVPIMKLAIIILDIIDHKVKHFSDIFIVYFL